MSDKNSTSSYLAGTRIRETRKFLKLRQADLANVTGISVSHLSDIERGALMPTIPTLQKIGQALERPLEYFLTDNPHTPRSLGMVVHRTLIGEQVAVKFAQLVAEKTAGEVTIQMYQHALPKSIYEQVRGVAESSIHIILDDLLSFEPYAPLCGVSFLPYFFQDRGQYQRFLHSDIFQEQIFQKLLKSGIRLLNPTTGLESDSFELLFSTISIFTPNDLKGRKIRSYESKPANALREVLGATPVHIHWKESYQAFQNGLIEAFLSPAVYVSALKLHEVAKYTTIIDYGYTQNLVVAISEQEYRKLPPSVQQALNEALRETSEYYGQTVRKQTQINLERLSSEYGIPVIHPDPNIWRERFTAAIRQICLEQGFLSKKLYEALRQI